MAPKKKIESQAPTTNPVAENTPLGCLDVAVKAASAGEPIFEKPQEQAKGRTRVKKYAQTASVAPEPEAPVPVAVVERTQRMLVSGKTTDFKSDLKALGGVWKNAACGWVLPAAEGEQAEKIKNLLTSLEPWKVKVKVLGEEGPAPEKPRTLIIGSWTTREYKDEIKALGGTFDPTARGWLLPAAEGAQAEKLRNLIGVLASQGVEIRALGDGASASPAVVTPQERSLVKQSAPSAPTAEPAAVATVQEGTERVLVTGKTYDFREYFKALGGKWSLSEGGWILPASEGELAEKIRALLTSLEPWKLKIKVLGEDVPNYSDDSSVCL